MFNGTFEPASDLILFQSSKYNEWAPAALAPCRTLTWIGIYLCFVFLCGILFNGIVLVVFILNKHLRSPTNAYIIALCLADFVGALLGVPLPLTSNFACRWLYGKYWCYYEGFITYSVGMIGLYLLTALSINRYRLIVSLLQEQKNNYRTAYMSISLATIGGFFWAIPPIFGWNDYTLEGVLTSCSIRWQDRTANVISYNVLMFIFAYVVPLTIMIYCNVKIFLKVREVAQRNVSWNKNKGISLTCQRQKLEQRIAKTIFVIIISFVFAWTPYAIVALVSSFISPTLISPLGGTLPAIFAKSSICFNPIFYIITSSEFRSNLKSIRKKNISSIGNTASKDASHRTNSTKYLTLPWFNPSFNSSTC